MLLGLKTKQTWIILFAMIFQNFSITWTEESINERLVNELQIDDQEMIEWYDNITQSRRSAYKNRHFRDFQQVEQYYGELLNYHVETLNEFTNYVPYDLEKNMTCMLKPGDWLLPATALSKVLRYKNYIEEKKTTVKLPCLNQTEDCFLFESDYLKTLRKTRNFNLLKTSWSAWQNIYNESDVVEYAKSLQLVKFSAKLNGYNDVKEYWQFLTDYSDQYGNAYDKAQEIWQEIEPFYRKLENFVKTRIQNYYKLNESLEYIPVYLLGDKFGSDWSEIAEIILPHPQLHYDVDSYLKYKDITDIYKYAETFTERLSLGKLGKPFWEQSNFNSYNCGPKFYEYPDQMYTSIEVCNQSSWTTFLDAHEVALTVTLNNRDYSSIPRQRLRFSATDHSISTLGSILAIETLEDSGILSNAMLKNSPADDPTKMTKLLLVALRILPQLPYYLAVDNFRLKEIEKYGLKIDEISEHISEVEINNVEKINVSATDLGKSWWDFRKSYQGIQGVKNTEPDLLNDIRVLQNTPLINRFYGVIIAFQLLEYYNGYLSEGGDVVKAFGQDETFKKIIDERTTLDWVSSLSLRYGLDVSASSLVNYFQPLEEYFSKAPITQVPIVTTTTTTTTTTQKSVIKEIHKDVAFRKSQDNSQESLQKEHPVNENAYLDNQNDTSKEKSQSGDKNLEQVADPSPNSPKNKETEGWLEPHSLAMKCGVALLVLVGAAVVGVFTYRYVRKRRDRRRNNNRRFDT